MIPPEHFHSCQHCQNFIIDLKQRQPSSRLSSDEKGIPSDIFFFNATLKDILNGVAGGCELCIWLDSLWKGSPSSNKERYDILIASANVANVAVCAETYSMSLVDRYPIDEIIYFGLWETDAPLHPSWGRCRVFAKCSVSIFTVEGNAADSFIWNRPINRFPGSAENLALAQQWLAGCRHSHPKCRDISQTYMPYRVLRIRDGCGSCDFHVTLEIRHKTGVIEPFVALSYCWGGDQVYKTTKARMESGVISLSWRKLPRSVQDAIKTTAALGLRCLWVDSLCIVQDDETDKALQIADMARIYSEATLTIIASRASQAADGFLGEIDLAAQTQLAVRVPFRCPDKDINTVGSAYLTCTQNSSDNRYSEPIDSRAWTLQERYLSNRILEFGSRQTRWTCTTSASLPSPSASAATIAASRSNNYNDGWTWNKDSEDRTSRVLFLHSELRADLAKFAAQRSSTAWVREWLHSRWQTVLSEYTPRLLSVSTDRILGISGVAQIFGLHLQNEGKDKSEEYLAGLWRSSLPSSLCWHAVVAEGDQRVKQQKKPEAGNGNGTRKGTERYALSPRPDIYQGPSWSWASINCHVLFVFSRACERDCRVVLADVNIKLANENAPYGSVIHGILTLKGRLKQALWNMADGTLQIGRDSKSHFGDENRNTEDGTVRKLKLVTIYPDTCDFPSEAPTRRGLVAQVWLLEVGNCVGLRKRGPVGLILDLVTLPVDQHHPRFRRLGLFHIDTRRAQKLPQRTSNLDESVDIENEGDCFEGLAAVTIELE
ncbi:heterokaryon incompatibility protein-domain-containing protein [Xylariaceae sp. FL1651]|nr:heterokaryon incompatibility protein-domain-containing protein [Xylariaceae sp. FL1651]